MIKMECGILWTHSVFQEKNLQAFRANIYGIKLHFFHEPLLKIKPLLSLSSDLKVQAVLITSQHALSALKSSYFENIPLYTVGKETALYAFQRGFKIVVPAKGSAQDLTNLLLKTRIPKEGPILYVRGKHVHTDIKAKLEKSGFQIHEKIVYETFLKNKFSIATKREFSNKRITDIFLFSKRGVHAFKKSLENFGVSSLSQNLRIFCLSPEIAKELQLEDYKSVYAASSPTLDSLANVFFDKIREVEDQNKNKPILREGKFSYVS